MEKDIETHVAEDRKKTKKKKVAKSNDKIFETHLRSGRLCTQFLEIQTSKTSFALMKWFSLLIG